MVLIKVCYLTLISLYSGVLSVSLYRPSTTDKWVFIKKIVLVLYIYIYIYIYIFDLWKYIGKTIFKQDYLLCNFPLSIMFRVSMHPGSLENKFIFEVLEMSLNLTKSGNILRKYCPEIIYLERKSPWINIMPPVGNFQL